MQIPNISLIKRLSTFFYFIVIISLPVLSNTPYHQSNELLESKDNLAKINNIVSHVKTSPYDSLTLQLLFDLRDLSYQFKEKKSNTFSFLEIAKYYQDAGELELALLNTKYGISRCHSFREYSFFLNLITLQAEIYSSNFDLINERKTYSRLVKEGYEVLDTNLISAGYIQLSAFYMRNQEYLNALNNLKILTDSLHVTSPEISVQLLKTYTELGEFIIADSINTSINSDENSINSIIETKANFLHQTTQYLELIKLLEIHNIIDPINQDKLDYYLMNAKLLSNESTSLNINEITNETNNDIYKLYSFALLYAKENQTDSLSKYIHLINTQSQNKLHFMVAQNERNYVKQHEKSLQVIQDKFLLSQKKSQLSFASINKVLIAITLIAGIIWSYLLTFTEHQKHSELILFCKWNMLICFGFFGCINVVLKFNWAI